jgi:hypothetical protein
VSDYRRDGDEPRPEVVEGVRIIGPDEVADAMDRDDVQPRLGAERPRRRRDIPPAPSPGAPPSALRFPLDSSAEVDQAAATRPPPRVHDGPAEMPSWTAGGPEEVPHMSPHDPYEGEETGAWSAFAGAGPRWRDDDPPPGAGGARSGRWPGGPQEEQPAYDVYQERGEGRPMFGGGPQAAAGSYGDSYGAAPRPGAGRRPPGLRDHPQ